MSVDKQNAPDLRARSDIYSHTAKVPGLIFCSGQVPMGADGKIVPGGIKEHAAQCISNIEKALKNAGSSLDHLVKVNIFLKSMDDFNAINEVYEKVSYTFASPGLGTTPLALTLLRRAR